MKDIWTDMDVEMREAVCEASYRTGKPWRQIVYEALRDWLINCGFMDEED